MNDSTVIQRGFILEDHADTADWLSDAMSQCFNDLELTLACTVAQAQQQLRQFKPQIALIDLGLPDGSGIEIVHTIRQNTPDCLRIVSTAFSDDEHLFAALQAGAQGYILKEQSREQLVDMLAAAMRGQPALSAAIARRILGHFQPEPEQTLSPRLSEVLTLIGRGYKNREVAELLDISSHTVHGYIREIYRILDISSRSEATLEATRRGLISPECR